MNLVERIEAPPAPFDYGQMARATADEARAAAGRYRSRSKAYVMDTGRDLIAIKERLDHGLFLKWIEAEMGLTPRTAQNFMQTAAQLGSKSEIVSHLPPPRSTSSPPRLSRSPMVLWFSFYADGAGGFLINVRLGGADDQPARSRSVIRAARSS